MNLRINLYAGPGAGKSTTAALVFGKLKLLGCSVELVNEYIKAWAYEKRKLESFDQVYIFAKQQRLEDRVLRAGVTMIVSDSPLYLQCMYARKYGSTGWQELCQLAKKFDEQYSALNIFLKRHDGQYDHSGRYQNYEEAVKVDQEILQFLNDYSIPFVTAENDPQEIVVMALHKMKEISTRVTT